MMASEKRVRFMVSAFSAYQYTKNLDKVDSQRKRESVFGRSPLDISSSLVKSKTAVSPYIELVDRAFAFFCHDETYDFADLLRGDEIIRVDVGSHFLDHFGGYTSGTDKMDPDSERLDFFSQHLCESCQSVFR